MNEKEVPILKKDWEIAIVNISWGNVEYVVKKGDKLILKKAELQKDR